MKQNTDTEIAANPWTIGRVWDQFGIAIVLALLVLLMICLSDSFLQIENIRNVLRQVSMVAICGIGMTFIMLAGEIDLSVGSVIAVSCIASTGMMVAGVNMYVSIAFGLLMSALCGCINGLVHTYGKVPSFIVTLGMLSVARGFVLVYTNSYPITGLPEEFAFFGKGYVGPVPTPVIIMALCYAVGIIVLKYTPFGRDVFAIGGNIEAARLSGISVRPSKVAIMTIGGLASGIAGIILASRMFSGQPSAGNGYELQAIAAATIGGTSAIGGRGNLVGTFIGALIIGVINNGLNLMGVQTYWQMICQGAVIVFAVWLDNLKDR